VGLQSKGDKLNEKRAKAHLENFWNVELYENPDFYQADWQAMRDDKHLALVEYKMSFKSLEEIREEFEGFRIGTNKFQFAFPIVQLCNQDFYFVIEFPSGLMLQHKLRPDANVYHMSRFFKSRNGGKDRMPAYVIPWELFEEVKENEFNSFEL
tara:strand:+ start:128 stop:586 length:459 start_codon:yes stop_codon:yes gene_type:complete